MQRPRPNQKQSGFTLVEIAIVLVIIGLLLGGILKGQEMITQARIKNVANDFNGITAAYFSYQDRYKAIPGDDGGANARWATVSAFNGNGDGQIQGNYNLPPVLPTALTAAMESLNFWWHLRLAGFVAGATANTVLLTQPSNVVGGIVGVQSSAMNLPGNIICSSNVPDKIAIAVDNQLDDQRPDGGNMRGFLQTAGTPSPNAPAAPTSPAYVETGSNQYLICRSI
jgi:prepilin-type N-terminal cleavage/methylation domain-containing protein